MSYSTTLENVGRSCLFDESVGASSADRQFTPLSNSTTVPASVSVAWCCRQNSFLPFSSPLIDRKARSSGNVSARSVPPSCQTRSVPATVIDLADRLILATWAQPLDEMTTSPSIKVRELMCAEMPWPAPKPKSYPRQSGSIVRWSHELQLHTVVPVGEISSMMFSKVSRTSPPPKSRDTVLREENRKVPSGVIRKSCELVLCSGSFVSTLLMSLKDPSSRTCLPLNDPR